MIYLTAIGLTPGGSSTLHIYTQTIHRTTQSTQTMHRITQITNTEQRNSLIEIEWILDTHDVVVRIPLIWLINIIQYMLACIQYMLTYIQYMLAYIQYMLTYIQYVLTYIFLSFCPSLYNAFSKAVPKQDVTTPFSPPLFHCTKNVPSFLTLYNT